jgi:Tol biopolymer transport system component
MRSRTTLSPGARLGPYEVVAALGAGGMGEVYKARDVRLDRTVALKVLAPEVAADPSFQVRFEREGRLISALNHPRICALYDLGRHDGIEYLVLEYLEGESLAARLERGPLRLPQVLKYAIEIADGLHAAHRAGIVHRDLKPANIMLTPTGAKLVDFGLGRPLPQSVAAISLQSTRAADASTAQGTFIGTLQYMAPEQLQGQETDARTDIFALGEIVYEMITGRKAFEAQTQASLVAKILETDPPAVSVLAPLAPPALDHLVQVCLAKEPSERWQTAHDVLVQLRWIQQEGSRAGLSDVAVARRKARWWLAGAVGVIALAAAAAGWSVMQRPAHAERPLARFEMFLPPHMSLPDFGFPMLSPDGRLLVVPASYDGKQQLYVRRLDDTSFVPLAGTEGARGPFWSPDSRSIAFFSGDKLRRVDAIGGPVTVICDGAGGLGGSWNRDGTILFTPGVGRPLFRVADSGGTPVQVTRLDGPGGDKGHVFPHFLPDGRTFLFRIGGTPESGIYAGSLDSPDIKRILPDSGPTVYVEPGYLLFVRQQTLMATRFDASRLEASSTVFPVAYHVRGGMFSIDVHGNLAYRSGGDAMAQLTWFTREGRRAGTVGAPGPYRQIVLSPSGRRVAIQQGRPGFLVEPDGDLWLLDVATGVHSRLTNHPAFDADPSWSPDERSLAFTSSRSGRHNPFRKDLITGIEEPFADIPERMGVDQWTPDGRFIILRSFGQAIHALPLSGDRMPKLLVDTPYLEDQSSVSPDGRWIAFNADESGRWEVYVSRFPDFSGKRQISNGGGMQPIWRRDGRELFYLTPRGHVMSVAIGAGDTLEPGPSRTLFQVNLTPSAEVSEYGVMPNGQRFLIAEPTTTSGQSIAFLLNWSPTNSAK